MAPRAVLPGRERGVVLTATDDDPDSEAESLEEGELDPDEVDDPAWWDEGADDEPD
ncbi:MAG: hypothetical protein ACM33B_12650 [Pseudomonadota bacterium]